MSRIIDSTISPNAMTLIISFSILMASHSVLANQKIEGCFVAKNHCEALHSIKKQSNPDSIKLEPYELYSIIAQNKTKATHYLIDIPNKNSSKTSVQRWVSITCGDYKPNCQISAMNPNIPNNHLGLSKPSSPTSLKKPQYLLALSWEPSFCETHQQKTECKTLTAKRYDAQHLSLHGLWPQPRNNAYCNVNSTTKAIDRRKKWHLIKPLELSKKTRAALAIAMPGYASNLQRHEWIKHGTCYGTSADIYYQHSIQLTKMVNDSSVGSLLAKNIGQQVTTTTIKNAFDESFGQGSGSKVNVRCDNKGRLAELWINLSGKISQQSSMAELLKNAPTAKSQCTTAMIDPA